MKRPLAYSMYRILPSISGSSSVNHTGTECVVADRTSMKQNLLRGFRFLPDISCPPCVPWFFSLVLLFHSCPWLNSFFSVVKVFGIHKTRRSRNGRTRMRKAQPLNTQNTRKSQSTVGRSKSEFE